MLASKEQIGKLDRRVTFQSKVTTQDDSNANAETGWSDVATVWAKVDTKQGTELLEADQVKVTQDLTFTIRNRTINNAWRISYNGSYYEIDSVQAPDRNRFLVITAFLRQDYAN